MTALRPRKGALILIMLLEFTSLNVKAFHKLLLCSLPEYIAVRCILHDSGTNGNQNFQVNL